MSRQNDRDGIEEYGSRLYLCWFIADLLISVASLIRMMGWNEVEIEMKNVNKNRPKLKLISKKEIELIREYNSLDIKFYNLVYNKYLTEYSLQT